MKRFVPCLLIVAVGFLSLAVTTPNASAQKWCQHIHQLSKKIVGQINTIKKCDYCTREKMEVYYIHHKTKGSIVQLCECDETNDDECGFVHGHPVSDDGDWEAMGCAFTGPSLGFPGNSEFTATIKRWVKYCKDGTDNPGKAWPRGGYHKGTWKITDGIDGAKLASGSLDGCEGVEPSFERTYQRVQRDFCDGVGCYVPGWFVGCLTGKTTDTFFSQTCPPSNSYEDINDDTTWESWKLKACYDGVIGSSWIYDSPCEQFAVSDWIIWLEGVIAIKAP